MTRDEAIAHLKAVCAQERVAAAATAAADPDMARRHRKTAAEKGWVSVFDDPNVTVRVSLLEAVCGVSLVDEDQLALDLGGNR